MQRVLTIEEFNQYCKQLIQIMALAQYDYDYHSNEEKYHSYYVDAALELQTGLLSYDLSNIPFEAWEDFTILSDKEHYIDFSNTKANIDFSLVHYYGNANFQGCNIRNLDSIKKLLRRQDFDQKTIQENPLLFLSNSFSDELQKKYNHNQISMEDLASINKEQLQEIKEKGITEHLEKRITNSCLYDILGIDKLLELYQYDENDFAVIMDLLYTLPHYQKESVLSQKFEKELREANVSEIKDICYQYVKSKILAGDPVILYCRSFPRKFVQENQALFLQHDDLPEEVQDRYFRRHLTIEDYVKYTAFHNIPIDSFMDPNIYFFKYIKEHYGPLKFQELVSRHLDVITNLSVKKHLNLFCKYLREMDDLEENFNQAVKYYCLDNVFNKYNHSIPLGISSMNYTVMDGIHSVDDLMSYQSNTILLNKEQLDVITELSIHNLKQLQEQFHFFFRTSEKEGLPMFDLLTTFLHEKKQAQHRGFDFKNGSSSYQDFLREFKKCIQMMKKENLFEDDVFQQMFISNEDVLDTSNYAMAA